MSHDVWGATADLLDPPPPAEHLRYQPAGACSRLFDCTEPEVVISGPSGTGKSMAGLHRMHLAALDYPGMRGLILRKTAVSLGSTTLVTYRKKVAHEALEDGRCYFYGGSVQEAAAYIYTNGSRLVVGGLDRAAKIMSGEYDLIFADEATELTEDDWEHLSTRLRYGHMPIQQQIAACNPSTSTHWIKQRADSGRVAMLESRHEDNPTLVADGELTPEGSRYIGLLDRLTGVRFLRLRKGVWASAEGVIYEEWDDAVHLIDRFTIPDSWTRWWTVDFGYVHPLVLQCWAEDSDGRLFMYREIFHTRRIVEDHARDILMAVTAGEDVLTAGDDMRDLTAMDVRRLVAEGRRQWTEPKPTAVICDHDAEDRATLERHLGFGTTPARKSVSDGIQAVQARMRPQADGRPRLFIMRDSVLDRDPELEQAKQPTCTAEEIPGYIWLPPSPNRQAKEQPLKERDDGVDAMRYMVAQRDLGSRPGVRWLS